MSREWPVYAPSSMFWAFLSDRYVFPRDKNSMLTFIYRRMLCILGPQIAKKKGYLEHTFYLQKCDFSCFGEKNKIDVHGTIKCANLKNVSKIHPQTDKLSKKTFFPDSLPVCLFPNFIF